MKGFHYRRNAGVTLFSALLAIAALFACRREFDSPYLPGSPNYEGDEWTAFRSTNGWMIFYDCRCLLANARIH